MEVESYVFLDKNAICFKSPVSLNWENKLFLKLFLGISSVWDVYTDTSLDRSFTTYCMGQSMNNIFIVIKGLKINFTKKLCIKSKNNIYNCKKPTANIIYLAVKDWTFSPLRWGKREEYPLSPLLFNIALESPDKVIREENKIKSI